MRASFISKILFFLILVPLPRLHAQDAVSTIAGIAQISGARNGPATNALFSNPAALVTDPAGNVFVADSRNHVIRKITPTGQVTTFAGQFGVAGTANATGTNAQFDTPSGLAFDVTGNLLVADTGNSTLRKITPAGAVTTLAGTPAASGFADGPAAGAQFNAPLGLLVAPNGTLYIADTGNHCLRTLNPATASGIVTTFAGRPGIWGSNDATGTNATFNGPVALAVDPRGNLFVSDTYNNTIRRITTNAVVTTYAGSPVQDGATDGSLLAARFRSPAGLTFDTHGDLFIADSFNQTIRQINPAGKVSTISGTPGLPGPADGINRTAQYYNPYAIVIATNGALLLTDAYNQTLRQLLPPFELTLQNGPANTNTVTLTWPTILGKTYQPQYREDVFQPWQNLGPALPSTGLTQTTSETSPAKVQMFRVVQIQ